jgi:2-methylcitrate synthase
MSKPAAPTYSKGLAGVIAGESSISTVGAEGFGLMYRGFSIVDLCGKASFEEVAHLLLYGTLPTAAELAIFQSRLSTYRRFPSELLEQIERIPRFTHPMNVMLVISQLYGAQFPEKADRSNQLECLERLLSAFGPLLLYWYHYHQNGKKLNFSFYSQTYPGDSLAKHFIRLLQNREDNKEPEEIFVRTVDQSLILYAEHGFAASTFACRVVISTQSDLYSGIAAAIGALRGNLHGGANEAAMELLARFKSADEAERGIREMWKRKELVMGFGHRIYRKGDPRSDLIKACSYKLSQLPTGNPQLYATSERIESLMMKEKKIFPNLDFYAASAYHQCGIPTDFFTPIFVIARTAGWGAHIQEQRGSNKLFRPDALYTGPGVKPFVSIKERQGKNIPAKL